jgi:hypothetical protein
MGAAVSSNGGQDASGSGEASGESDIADGSQPPTRIETKTKTLPRLSLSSRFQDFSLAEPSNVAASWKPSFAAAVAAAVAAAACCGAPGRNTRETLKDVRRSGNNARDGAPC